MWRDFLSEYICPKGLLGEKSISGEEIEEKFDQLVIKKVKDLEKSIKKCRWIVDFKVYIFKSSDY